jgi:hypothetical protein
MKMGKIHTLTVFVLLLSLATAWGEGFKDDFDRADGDPENGWTTRADGTIEVKIVDNEILIAGQQGTDWVRSGISRAVQDETRFAFDFKADDAFNVHIRLEDAETNAFFEPYWWPGGPCQYASSEDGSWPGWSALAGSEMIAGEYNTVVVEQDGAEFSIILNDVVVGTITNNNLTSVGTVLIDSDAAAGTDGSLHIDNVQIGVVVLETAKDPSPAAGVGDLPRDVILGWTPGALAATHDVYFGTSFDDVSAASTSDPRGVLVGPGLTDSSLDVGRLAFDQTYYWRVDEVNGAPDYSIFPGSVWAFTVEPFSYPLQPIGATASSSNSADMGPEKTIDGSGLNAADQHGSVGTDMWLSAAGTSQWIQYDFDKAYKLDEMWVWNSNQLIESFIGFGAKDVVVETSIDGAEWTVLEGAVLLNQATGTADYAANTIVDFAGAMAQSVRITVNAGWGTIPQFGLSELRFFYIPTAAREPMPADASLVDSADIQLSWRAGREAASHEVYLGTDPGALGLAGTSMEAGYNTGALSYGTTYYWSVTEVNEAEAVTSYASDTWSFTTPDYGKVDDFDQYDDNCKRIFFAWEDGLGHNGGQDIEDCDVPASNGNGGGSIVGNDQAPFAEKTIVNAGSTQSLPFNYDNAFGPSEATLTVDGQDWTASAIQTLSLFFRGTAGNTGELYIKINNSKIAYDGAAADIGTAAWQPWNIDLTGVSGLQNVQSLTIGVDGASAAGMLYFDDMRLYPLAGEMLTPADPGNAALVALYAFDGNANDSAGNGYNGVENGTPSYEAGVTGQALSLDGFASYVTIDSVGIGSAAPRSIAGWAKADTDSMATWTNVFGFTGSSTNGEHFDIQIVGSTGTTTAGSFGLHRHGWEMDITANDLEWHHLAATFDGTTVSVYGDGRLVNTDTVSNVNTPGPVHMGKRQDNDNYFEGLVDDVRIYDTALSQEEIAWIAGKRTPMHKAF